MSLARFLRRLRKDRRGVTAVEFALSLPLFLGVMISGVEISWLMMANMKVQRLATMTADLVARDGASQTQISEAQIYDILSAMDVAASPLDIRGRGRVIISAVVGEDTDNNGSADVNRIKWQRFDGALTSANRIIGCVTSSTVSTTVGRQLKSAEPLYHVQVTYQYQPIFSATPFDMFQVPTTITRTASYRGRGAIYHEVLTVEGYPAKTNCTSATGL